MKIADVKKIISPYQRLRYWIAERESIRLKRERKESPPWTDDEILGTYRFCNVRRMDDKVSKWLMSNWYEPNHGHENMLGACALARFINLPSSLAVIGFPKKWDKWISVQVKEQLRKHRDAGNTIFNGAYIVRGNDGPDKISSVVDAYVDHLFTDPITFDGSSMQDVHKALVPRFGFGSFMAGQVVADLRWATPGQWSDRMTWAPPGPGSVRGMNRLLEMSLSTTMKPHVFLAHLQDVMKRLIPLLPDSITSRMECHDWQNCLCEYDGYERTLWGEGRKKEIFKGADKKYGVI